MLRGGLLGGLGEGAGRARELGALVGQHGILVFGLIALATLAWLYLAAAYLQAVWPG